MSHAEGIAAAIEDSNGSAAAGLASLPAAAADSSLLRREVAVVRSPEPSYPSDPPFHPDQGYPEYPFGDHLSSNSNHVYAAVRDSLRLLGLDSAHYGTPGWNPLGELIRPGNRVIIKPNFVLHTHFSNLRFDSVVTHAS